MSEYQYFEFRAVDKPLTGEQLKRLRAISTRAAISSTSFVNTYEWGDFKGNPSRLMEQMFDAFLYWANWGTRLFQVRLPGNLGSLKRIKPYCVGPFARVRAHGKDLILEFIAGEIYDDYYDDEEDDWMGSLLPLRQDLLRGDYRCLYLAWLRSVQEEAVEDDEPEPPLPEGLRDESEPLSAFGSFFEIDLDLIEAAADASDPVPAAPSTDELAKWVQSRTVKEKDALLRVAVHGGGGAFQAELLRLYDQGNRSRVEGQARSKPRKAGELRAAANARAEVCARKLRLQQEAEKWEREAKQAAARTGYLDRLVLQEEKAWDQIGDLIATKRPNDYDRAVQLLLDLRDLAMRDKREADFRFGLRTIREENANKPSLQRRLSEAGLPNDREPSLPIIED